MIKQAIILAAGEGTRMRPITDEIPKPMVKVMGEAMIEKIIDDLILYGIKRIVINTYYKADLLEKYITSKYCNADKVQIIFSRESELMNSGGGIDKALSDGKLKFEDFLVINSDMIYSKLPEEITLLASAHSIGGSKITMLIKEPRLSFGIEDIPTYIINEATSELHKISSATLKGRFCYVGVSILNPSIFNSYKKTSEKFSLSDFFMQASNKSELRGVVSVGNVYQIDRPCKLEQYEKLAREKEGDAHAREYCL